MTSSSLAALALTELDDSPPTEPGITRNVDVRPSLSKPPPGGPDAKHPGPRLRSFAAALANRARYAK